MSPSARAMLVALCACGFARADQVAGDAPRPTIDRSELSEILPSFTPGEAVSITIERQSFVLPRSGGVEIQTPTPGSGALLLMGLGLIARRRRRPKTPPVAAPISPAIA
ncbi:MAG: MYXO-CTERM sorting domain-containing protein [Planctomycetota bacterium]